MFNFHDIIHYSGQNLNETVRTEMHPLLILFFGIVIGALLLLFVVATVYFRYKKQREDEIQTIQEGFQKERQQTEDLLNDIDLGVLAFAADGRLRLANRMALTLLNLAEAPKTLADFLSAFGEENGLKTQALLGTGRSSADFSVGKKVITLHMTEVNDDESHGNYSTLIVAQDVTDQLEQEKQRKEFVANVSHELKTPLTIIKTYSESLLDWGLEEKSPEAVKADLQRILDDVNRMENLIKDLLLLSSIDSRGKAMHMEEVDPAALAKQIVDRCQLQAKDKDIDLSCVVLSSVPTVFVDRTAIDRAVMNIIQNAIKYTDKGGRIDVFLSRMWEDIVIKVRDNGQGIDPKHQKAIFDRFYRVDNTGSRKYGGTGLGLAIAKELTELHHGKISVSSMPTQGSEFSITLPSAGKLYRKVMLSLVQESAYDSGDLLLKEARKELLSQAQDKGMTAENLEDLTRSEREELISPYRIADPEEEADEDFAGVFRVGKETESAPETQEPQVLAEGNQEAESGQMNKAQSAVAEGEAEAEEDSVIVEKGTAESDDTL